MHPGPILKLEYKILTFLKKMLGLSQKTKDIELELLDTTNSPQPQQEAKVTAPMTEQPKPTRIGIYFRMLSGLSAIIFYAFRKLIPEVSSTQYTFDRAICSIILMSLYFYYTKQFDTVKKTFERKIIFISGATCLADILYFVALLSLPISEIVTIISMIAIFNGIIGSYLLGEPYLKIEKILGAISFVGVFLIVRPPFIFGTEENDGHAPTGSLPRYLAGLLTLGCAVIYSFVQVNLREIQKRMSAFVATFYINLGYVVFLGVYFMLVGSHKSLTLWEVTLIIGSSVFHLTHLILIAKALQLEKPAVVGLVGYTNLVFSPIFDLVIFGTLPSLYTVLGASLIVGSCVKLLLMKM